MKLSLFSHNVPYIVYGRWVYWGEYNMKTITFNMIYYFLKLKSLVSYASHNIMELVIISLLSGHVLNLEFLLSIA